MTELRPNLTDSIAYRNFDLLATDTDMRTHLYEKCGVPKTDFYEAAIDSLNLQGNERILEAGYGSGGYIKRILQRGHHGQITGIDLLPEDAAYQCDFLSKANIGQQVHLFRADVREMPFADDAFDALSSNYTLYHVYQPERALREFQRVVVPGGKVSILTRGTLNLVKQWEFAADIAQSVGIEKPQSQYANFSAEDATDRLSEIFTIDYENSMPSSNEETFVRLMPLRADDWYPYSYSLNAVVASDIMARSDVSDEETRYLLSVVRKKIEDIVKPQFDEQIASKGYFLDLAQDKLIACINDKK